MSLGGVQSTPPGDHRLSQEEHAMVIDTLSWMFGSSEGVTHTQVEAIQIARVRIL